jgi:hypothetical protein
MRRIAFLAAICGFGAATILAGSAQEVKLFGGVFRVNHSGSDPLPYLGAQVFLYPKDGGDRIGPSVTDASGHFSFYDIPDGTYLLQVQIEVDYEERVAWRQSVRVPSTVRPIVLP